MCQTQTTPRALVGLSNLGNTCFMNSVLQCLVNTAPLSAYFVADEYSGELNRSSKSWQLVDDYASLAKDMWRTAGNTHTSINPSALKMQISRWARQFSGYEQHDSQELLRFLLDGLQEGLMRPKREPPWPYDDKDFEKRAIAEQSRRMWENYLARNNSQITDIFCGQLRSRVTCATCKRESNCYDPFMDLSLPIPKKFQGLSKWRSSAQECKLQDCLEQFVDEEKLEGNEMYYCSRCKKHQVAIKEMKIFRCPLVLVLHLKRFDKRSSSRSKLNASVRFPTASLELAPYMSSDSPDLSTSTFDLYGETSLYENEEDDGRFQGFRNIQALWTEGIISLIVEISMTVCGTASTTRT
ncbi:hypothetical protein GUITHDRAFT_106044 [Guillardia theta CCMP2712]|uniref:USP domain-containing protein n=1 Tax=Guillardia theta (strain CCMP2712) TaxID=905079 RepID=L1JI16_GUITC|nr:hypothetical protein GUITHDRAFT_106044 [Guillardia theta CCMP2712]EKX47957.1 hypothetical protein GUITHDRAFT_106044 [Guillardia theta CCMP2712]|eukprot:XP_005834937.1 hypothetical protein GUITHDRAFT_106044 [Guillardia theta CCMP2712]